MNNRVRNTASGAVREKPWPAGRSSFGGLAWAHLTFVEHWRPVRFWSADILVRLFAPVNAKADRNVRAPTKVRCARPASSIQNGLGGSLALPLEGFCRSLAGSVLVAIVLTLVSCGKPAGGPAVATEDPHLTTNGTVEVTAKLVEIPDGAIFKRDLYDYATILKYQVIRLHRGQVATNTIFVGHYNPWKPRAEAADKRVKNIGGTLKQFRAGEIHRMALEAPIDDHFMGGIVNKYFGQETGLLYWAVWVNLAKE